MELLTADEIFRLSPPERIALIAQLWDSLEADQLPLTGAQQAELESRLASLDEDRREGVTWAALKADSSNVAHSVQGCFYAGCERRNDRGAGLV
jgi:putative addiction module component (TIGR02574 family)